VNGKRPNESASKISSDSVRKMNVFEENWKQTRETRKSRMKNGV
jgi:hypothetical protein